MKRFPVIAVIVTVAVGLGIVACTPDEVTPNTNTNNNNTSTSYNVNKQKLLNLVNNQRSKGCTCGSEYMPPVAAVTWNNLLANAALGHSKDMNVNSYFSHTSQDGTTFSARVTAAGYNWASVGENIAVGYTSEAEVIEAWIESAGHCKNLMSPKFTEMGVARSGNYWTQNFGKPK